VIYKTTGFTDAQSLLQKRSLAHAHFWTAILVSVLSLILSCPLSAGQSAQEPTAPRTPTQEGTKSKDSDQKNDTVLLSSSTSNVHVASPDEAIAVNGRVMRMADYLALLSLLDSLEAQRPRIPATHNRESTPPTPPAKRPN
jgi:hypothetical protein